jgi:outer membrane PBP1 activator LpoA protein
MTINRLSIVVFLSLCASGCSTQMAYQSVQEMQRAQCDKLTDLQEMQRCRANARQTYDNYQRDREVVKPSE